MPVAFQPEAPLYVYAVVPASPAICVEATGVDGQPVTPVCHGHLAALVSPAIRERVRPSRANLTAHQDIVSRAHQLGPVLPVRFGTVMPGEAAVIRDLLQPGRRDFEMLLADFEGKDEYRVKCRYLPDVALREVVEGSRTIQRLRARAGEGAHQSVQLQLGELVFAGLERLRHRDAAAVLEALGPHTLAWEQIGDAAEEDLALHAALLVDRSAAGRMERALEQLAEAQKHRLQLELIGPLPLWDFSQATPGAA